MNECSPNCSFSAENKENMEDGELMEDGEIMDDEESVDQVPEKG